MTSFYFINGLMIGLLWTYSSVPNKRSYLNNHTYQKFAQNLLNVPTQISIPTGNLIKDNELFYLPDCTALVNVNIIVGITLEKTRKKTLYHVYLL